MSPEFADPSHSIALTLPNLFVISPLSSTINPHYKQAGAASAAWIDSFNFFSGRAREHFMRSDFELLAALAFPKASYDDFRTICDYMNSFFVFDNISDEQDGTSASITATTYVKALAGEECEQSDTVFYKFVAEFSKRIRSKNLPLFQRRFIQNHGSYVNAVVREADLRTRGVVLSFDEYMILRRDTVGARPSFDMMEFALDIDLPDEVFSDAAFQRAYYAAIDMIALANDLHSYKKEYAAGQDCLNAINILMKTKGMSLQEAFDYVGVLSDSLMMDYLKSKSLIHYYGLDLDADVQLYLRNMDDWVSGSLEWDFRSKRYFGDENEKVRVSHVVRISPRAA